jgi:hypothetical protein
MINFRVHEYEMIVMPLMANLFSLTMVELSHCHQPFTIDDKKKLDIMLMFFIVFGNHKSVAVVSTTEQLAILTLREGLPEEEP